MNDYRRAALLVVWSTLGAGTSGCHDEAASTAADAWVGEAGQKGDAAAPDDGPGDGPGAGSDVSTTGQSPDAALRADEFPRRVVFLSSELGIYQVPFAIHFPGQSDLEAVSHSLLATDFEWSSTLSPLKELAQEMIVVEGLTNFVAIFDSRSDNQMEGAIDATLSGSMGPRSGVNLPSLDRLVGRENHPAQGIPVLNLGRPSVSHEANGFRIEGAATARDAFAVLKKAIPGEACLSMTPPVFRSDETTATWMDQVSQLIGEVFRCDRTRVVTISVPRPTPGELMFSGDLHQDCGDMIPETPMAEPAGAIACFSRFNRLTAAYVASLAKALAQIPEGPHSMLDQTLIVWVSEEAAPGHRLFPWHGVTVGGRGMGIKTGRYLRVAQEVTLTLPFETAPRTLGAGHNRFLTSVAQSLGMKVDAVGLRAVTARNGLVIDLTGPVPGF